MGTNGAPLLRTYEEARRDLGGIFKRQMYRLGASSKL